MATKELAAKKFSFLAAKSSRILIVKYFQKTEIFTAVLVSNKHFWRKMYNVETRHDLSLRDTKRRLVTKNGQNTEGVIGIFLMIQDKYLDPCISLAQR
ncbi:MAG: hypothetical protein U5L45_09050 [Saprospiraceae bacterium]|nr:hypothetical protein [Saprospiraceae bacterium]